MFTLILYPFFIFLVRIIDVPIGTLRIIFLAKGKKLWVPILGFFEVLLWLIVMTKIMQNIDKPVYYIAYAGGFAAGSWVGMMLEEKLAMGIALVRIITSKPAVLLVEKMKSAGYMVTDVPAAGGEGPVNVVFTIVKRRAIKELVQLINEFNPNAFYTIEDIGYVSKNILPSDRQNVLRRFMFLARK
jgi:uncharacterized protein YebE (UPF0316 family)